MEILITLAILSAVGFVLLWKFDDLDALGLIGFMTGVLGACFFVVALITVPVNRMSVQSRIAEFQEVRATAERMRDRGDTWESAAFQTKVADRNAWLASTQYYNATVFDLWIPDAVKNMEPIQ